MVGFLPRKPLYRRLLWITCAVAVLVAALDWYGTVVVAPSEEAALEFVRLRGCTSEGYRHTPFSSLISFVPRSGTGRPFGTIPIVSVSFPRDRMTDSMAEQLLQIRQLAGINLYPADPQGRGVDYDAKVATKVASLRNADVAVSEKNIAKIEEQFPNLLIRLVDRPSGRPAGGEESGEPETDETEPLMNADER